MEVNIPNYNSTLTVLLLAATMLISGMMFGYHFNEELYPDSNSKVLGATTATASQDTGRDFEVKSSVYSSSKDVLEIKGYVSDQVFVTLYDPINDVALVSQQVVGDWTIELKDISKRFNKNTITLEVIATDQSNDTITTQNINFAVDDKWHRSYTYVVVSVLLAIITILLFLVQRGRLSAVATANNSDIVQRFNEEDSDNSGRFTIEDYVDTIKKHQADR